VPKYLFFIVIFSLLSACAGRVEPLLAAGDFTLEGKLSVSQDGRNQSANFRWRQLGEQYDVEVWGLLGQGRTRLTGESEHLAIQRGGVLLASGPPSEVMQAHLGFSLPVEVMWAWLQGYAASGGENLVLGDNHELVGFEEYGWYVAFAKYRSFNDVDGQMRPSRIVASRGTQKVTVAIRRFLK
jgi:outer membrane biogenesis lipoprotein LolB